MTERDVFNLVTGLGDPVLLVPGAALLTVYLVCRGARRTALSWLQAFVLSAAVTGAAKLGFLAFGHGMFAVESPSGHTGLAATFYLCSALALARGAPPGRQRGLFAAAAALVLAIAASRVFVGGHDVPEILAGLAIGGGSAAWFLRRSGGEAISPGWHAPLLAAFAALAVLLNGWHVNLEPSLARLAAGAMPSAPSVIRPDHQAWLVF